MAGDAVANPTDPDSEIMKGAHGWVQGHNAQCIATERQIILAVDLTSAANNRNQLEGMVEMGLRNLRKAKGGHAPPVAVVADAGYCSKANAALEIDGCDIFLATRGGRKMRKEGNAPPNGPPPPGLSALEYMEWKMGTEQGMKIYRMRGGIIEATFGQMKRSDLPIAR